MPADATLEPFAPLDLSAEEPWSVEPWANGAGARARELWQYRRLALFFGVRAMQRLYARTRLGWLWLFIRPLFPLLVKTLVFGGVLAVSSGGVPYFLFLVAGSTIWELFASAVTWGTRSLDANRGLLRQIYVPRLILPLANLTPALVTLGIHLAVLAGAVAWYAASVRFAPRAGAGLVWAPIAVVQALALALAVSLWTSVPAMVARDVRFTLAYALGFWVLLTPVMYPLSAVPARWRGWMLLNPMAPIVEAFRAAVLGTGGVVPWQLGVSAAMTAAVFAGGLVFFLRAEADAVDRV